MLSNIDRAKQFLPFDSLVGFGAAIKERAEIKEERVELSEEKLEEISNIVKILGKGDSVQIEHYDGMRYSNCTGKIIKVDDLNKDIEIEKNEEIIIIKFHNIKNIKIL